MRQIDRELLEDMGFERGVGWAHEAWVYEGRFWVHFGESPASPSRRGNVVWAGDTSRADFFEAFFDEITTVEYITPLE